MTERLDESLESALFNLNKFGLKPPTEQLEKLVQLDLLESSVDDGWIISMKGMIYIYQHLNPTKRKANG